MIYPNINISVLCCRSANSQSLTGFLKYLPINMALLAQKLWRKKICKNPFPAILRRKKKFPMATKKKTFFLRLP